MKDKPDEQSHEGLSKPAISEILVSWELNAGNNSPFLPPTPTPKKKKGRKKINEKKCVQKSEDGRKWEGKITQDKILKGKGIKKCNW